MNTNINTLKTLQTRLSVHSRQGNRRQAIDSGLLNSSLLNLPGKHRRQGSGRNHSFNSQTWTSFLQLLLRLLEQLQHHRGRPNQGTENDDQLTGTRRNDRLHGRGGNDHIRGLGGNDRLYGNSGNDSLYGGRGNDRLIGGSGDDLLNGGTGRDRLYGGTGNDILKGNDGSDIFIDNYGNNTIDGGDGRDEVRFSGRFSDYEVMVRGDKFIFENKNSRRNNINVVSNVERFTFRDQSLSLSTLQSQFMDNGDHQYHSYDGSFNNLQNPDIGKVDSPYRQLMPKNNDRAIGGSEYDKLPNPRDISNKVFSQAEPTENRKGLSDMFWLWGQFLDHDIDLTPTVGTEKAPIPIPAGDTYFDPQGTGNKSMDFDRSIAIVDENGVRHQTNHITAFLDGSNIYGSSKAVQDEIRSFQGGKLILDANDRLPKTADGQFLSGDVRVNENVGLTSMHTIWAREHNRIADQLAQEHPEWDDQKLFQEARKKVVGEMQAITNNEYLPQLLGGKGLSDYRGYNPKVSPQISNEFATAAYRYGHTMLSPNILRLDESGQEIPEGHLPLRDAFFRPDKVEEAGVDPILRGFAAHTAQAADAKLVDDVRNFLFGPPGSGGLDLATLNIQRGRDHGIASYNDVREALGLHRITSFDDPVFKNGAGERLASAYKSPDDIDLWVGGLAEKPDGDALMGATFSKIIKEQFERTRDGDRFWYENRFSGKELEELNNLKLADIIKRNTGVNNIQDNVFIASSISHDTKEAGATGTTAQATPQINIPKENVVALANGTIKVEPNVAENIVTRALDIADAEAALASGTVTTTAAEINKELGGL